MLTFVVVVSLLLTYIPILSKYIALINTFIHEIGHAFMSIVTFGEVYKIKLNTDTSGYATTGSRWWVGRVLTTFAGYPFSLLFPSVMIYLAHKGESESVLYTLIGLLAVSILLWIRDFLSLIWCVSILVVLVGVLKYNAYVETAMVAVMMIALSTAARSTYDIFRLSLRQSNDAGDTTSLFKSTLIPPQIWGTIFLALGIAVPLYTILLLFGKAPDYYTFMLHYPTIIDNVAGYTKDMLGIK